MAVAAFKQTRAVFTTNLMKPIVVGPKFFPDLKVSTNAEIVTLIQQSASASYHASATCKMGLANDSVAVLDSKARVFGMQGLQVVNASAFPILPPGYPASTISKWADLEVARVIKALLLTVRFE